jgi:uncharacterized protein (DUF433 family)
MDRELEKEVKTLEENLSTSERAYDLPELEEQDVKEILHDVLNELYYSKAKR